MNVYLIYDRRRNYPVHGEDSVDTVEVFSTKETAEEQAARRNAECPYPKGHDLGEEWVVREVVLQ